MSKKIATLAAAATAATMSGATEIADAKDGFIVQFVKFETSKTRDDLLPAAIERKPFFEEMPGLIQKYYVEFDDPNTYGGIYIWESREAMAAFTQTELFKTIPAAYGLAGKPEVQIGSGLFPLR